MNATVMEIREGYAVLLKKDGTFERIRCGNLAIGDVVNMKETKKRRTGTFGPIAAAALFVAFLGGGVYTYATPAYYVSVDVNPGIIMEVNMYDRVIGLEAVNEDGEEVLEGLTLENTNIEDALSQSVERINELGYFEEEGGEILIGAIASDEDQAEEIAEKLGDAVESDVEEKGVEAEVTAKIVGREMVQAAKLIEGMTPGKYNIIVNLLGIEPESAAEYVGTSVKDLMKEFKASKNRADDETEKEIVEEIDEIPSETIVDDEEADENTESVENAILSVEEVEEIEDRPGRKDKDTPSNKPAYDKKNSKTDALKNRENRSENQESEVKPVKQKKAAESIDESSSDSDVPAVVLPEPAEKNRKNDAPVRPVPSRKQETPAGRRP